MGHRLGSAVFSRLFQSRKLNFGFPLRRNVTVCCKFHEISFARKIQPATFTCKQIHNTNYQTFTTQTHNTTPCTMAEGVNLKHEVDEDALPVVTRLGSPEFKGLFSKELKILQDLFYKNNYELRLCGGAVRDLLLGIRPKDLDFATTATPDEMINMFEREEIRLINPGGWGHGTVTCRVGEENFEITTLRIDRVTDGRRAIVEYTTDWRIDASRRDLTFNSMFLTLDGDLIDFFGGKEDLFNRFVRFVGNPNTRIQEDYLRILRYFRFYGRIANDKTETDEETLNVISQNAGGLKQISGERIKTELTMIFNGKNLMKIVKMMHGCGLFHFVGLPENCDLDEFEEVFNSTRHLNPHHMTLVSALLPTLDDLETFHKRTKCSNYDLHVAEFILKHKSCEKPADKLSWYVDILIENKQGCQPFFMEFVKYNGDIQALDYFRNFRIPHFPVSGITVKQLTGAKGKEVGKVMKLLFERWKESRYTMTEEELTKDLSKNAISGK